MNTVSQYKHSPQDDSRLRAIIDTINNTPDHPLQGYQSVFEQVVAWGDMDIFQHLNNVRYYDYSQSARIDHLTRLGLHKNGAYTVIVSTSCQYMRSVYFPDTLWIGVRVKKIGNTSLTHEYCYYSTDQQAVVATGESVVVNMDADGNKRAFSEAERATIQALRLV